MRVPCAGGGDALRFDIASPCLQDFQDVERGCKNGASVISHEEFLCAKSRPLFRVVLFFPRVSLRDVLPAFQTFFWPRNSQKPSLASVENQRNEMPRACDN